MQTETIITKLASLFTTITDIKQIATVEKESYSNYPCVVITPLNWQEEYLSLRDTSITDTCIIRIIGDLSTTKETTQQTVRNIAVAIRDILNKNVTLDSTISYAQLTTGQFRTYANEQPLYICEMNYKANYLFNRYA